MCQPNQQTRSKVSQWSQRNVCVTGKMIICSDSLFYRYVGRDDHHFYRYVGGDDHHYIKLVTETHRTYYLKRLMGWLSWYLLFNKWGPWRSTRETDLIKRTQRILWIWKEVVMISYAFAFIFLGRFLFKELNKNIFWFNHYLVFTTHITSEWEVRECIFFSCNHVHNETTGRDLV